MRSRRRNRSEALPGRASPERETLELGRVDICWASRERAMNLRRPDPRARSRPEGTLLPHTQGSRRSLNEGRFRSGHGQRSPVPSWHRNSARGGRARVSLGCDGYWRTGSGNRFVIGKSPGAPGPLAVPARTHARRRSVALGAIFRADRRRSARRGMLKPGRYVAARYAPYAQRGLGFLPLADARLGLQSKANAI